MTATTIRVQMAQRKDTAANWTAANPILLSGEIGYETDTKKFKIGDGTTNWNSLAYLPIPDGSGNLTITGNLEIGTTGTLTFEGSTANDFETTLAVTDPTADRTITLPDVSGTVVTTGDTGTVTSTMIADGTIVDGDINASAAIALSKLATGALPTAITVASANIVDGTIVDADISGSAEIAVSKLADGAARQLLQTDAAGTGVEWTDNVDVPGTLDVTSTATFDSIASHPLGSAAAPTITFTGDTNTGIYSPGTDQVAISTNGTQRINIEADGDINIDSGGVFYDATNNRLAIGTTSPGDYDLGADDLVVANSGNGGISIITGTSSVGALYFGDGTTSNNPYRGRIEYKHAEDSLNFGSAGSLRATIDSSGRLLVGTSSSSAVATAVFEDNSASNGPSIVYISSSNATPADGDGLGIFRFSSNNHSASAEIAARRDGGTWTAGSSHPSRLAFSTTADGGSSPTERMRITSDGDVLISKDTTSFGTDGIVLADAGYIAVTRTSATPLSVIRNGTDGTLVNFEAQNVSEGSISVSGTTVTLNGAHLSRWSQLSGIDPYDKTVRPEILRGTVMSNLDEMCDWTCPTSGDCQDNEQLNKTKISDVEGDKNVAGVFQSWDDDDDTWVNDFYLAMTGDFVIRIAAGTTVQRGDLLMSAGDGTAKPQDDDIIRSKTIAKVTSTNVSCTHPDGSYCVPCVLMAC